MKIEIWHNPRCRKSREGLKFLEDNHIDFEIRQYLMNIPTADEIKKALDAMGLGPREIIRTKEKEYKELGLNNLSLSEDQLIQAMADYPKLIERPIIIDHEKGKAVLGRPVENLGQFFK